MDRREKRDGMTKLKAPLTAALALALSACGGTDDSGTGQQSLCEDETRAMEYAAGLEMQSEDGTFTVRLVEGTPAPPDRGDNTWTLQIMDASGTPMTPERVRVKAWMPDHGHGTNPLWTEAEDMGDGMYSVGPFDLFMGGLWEFTVEAGPAADADTAKLSFCLEG